MYHIVKKIRKANKQRVPKSAKSFTKQENFVVFGLAKNKQKRSHCCRSYVLYATL